MRTAERGDLALYTLADAARLLRTPSRTLQSWAKGYRRELVSGLKRYEGLLPNDEPIFAFGGLVELLYVREFRRHGVPLKDIRAASERYRQEWDVRYPFATRKFATNGKDLLRQKGNQWCHALTGQASAFFEDLGRQFVHDGDLIGSWWPLGQGRRVVLDPSRRFGQPIDPESGVPCAALARALTVEGDAQRVARLYEVSPEAVRDAQTLQREALIR